MNNKLILVPLEPLQERYTEQWYRRLPEAFRGDRWDVTIVDGEVLVDDDIKVGTFLDINSTAHYKFVQLQKIAAMFNRGEVQPGTVFFFSDIEFWGIESIRLMARMNQVEVYLTGFLHAASYTIGDAFEVAQDFQKYTEVGWIAAMDQVFVGSEYHKDAVYDRRLAPFGARKLRDRLVVTKNPLFMDEYHQFKVPKEKRVLLTNRTDAEKDVSATLDMFEKVAQANPDWKFVLTTSRKELKSNRRYIISQARDLQQRGLLEIHEGLTKAQYHEQLARGAIMVSHSPEENYGYCVAEALHYGCCPLLLNGASHPEFVPHDLLFDSNEQGEVQLQLLMREFELLGKLKVPKLDTSGMDNILNAIRKYR